MQNASVIASSPWSAAPTTPGDDESRSKVKVAPRPYAFRPRPNRNLPQAPLVITPPDSRAGSPDARYGSPDARYGSPDVRQVPPPSPFSSRLPPPSPESRLGSFLAGSLQLVEILGTGAYGVVYKAIDVSNRHEYAVKALSKFTAQGFPLDERQRAFQTREIELHWRANTHPNVVSMYRIFDDDHCTYVILEYCPEGDLFSNITEKGKYVQNDDLIRRVFCQILDAVQHCHDQGIFHRDLKPENILVADAGNQVKLADFGLATTDIRSTDHGCGSTFYMSPECLDQSARKPSYLCAPNDVWSLGVILVNLTCGRNPWKQASSEDSTYRAFSRSPDFLKTILPLTEDLNRILGMIFEPVPERRITIPELRREILNCRVFSTLKKELADPMDVSAEVFHPVQQTEDSDDDSGYDSASDGSKSDAGTEYTRQPLAITPYQDFDAYSSRSVSPVDSSPATPAAQQDFRGVSPYVLPSRGYFHKAEAYNYVTPGWQYGWNAPVYQEPCQNVYPRYYQGYSSYPREGIY